MMSSAIPARLQFQCGHAAIVSLPRIKGETTAQRNDRIAREKSSALSRECDFCAPAMVTAVNGNGHVEETPYVEATSVLEETPLLVEPEASVVEEVVPVAEAAPVIVVDETPALVEMILAEETLAAEEQVVAEEAVPAVSESIDGDGASAPRAVRRRAQRKPRAEEVARGRRFLVEYRVERVLHAVDIHDALRQAATLGAVTAITREG
jgi:hypothetical protein